MNESRERWALRVLSGEDRSLGASALRGLLRVAEPFYAVGMAARNALYDAGLLASHALPRPTISVGNLTTGGTGKTPVVRWLAEQLIAAKLRPAILMRGYRGESTGGSDEARMLSDDLAARAIIIPDPDRVAAASYAMMQSPPPPPDVFLLDDGFQHRRARRDFDLVLINAADPFGHGHVLPRGLMREPARGLRRADAFILTRAGAADAAQLERIRLTLRRWNDAAPIYLAEHVHAGVRAGDSTLLPIEQLRDQKFFAFSGIAGPSSLRRQFESHGAAFVGFRAFPDHHAYTRDELLAISADAATRGAELIVTTEKDWVKVRSIPADGLLPIVRTELQIRFRENDGAELLQRVLARITASRARGSPAALPAASPGGSAEADRAS